MRKYNLQLKWMTPFWSTMDVILCNFSMELFFRFVFFLLKKWGVDSPNAETEKSDFVGKCDHVCDARIGNHQTALHRQHFRANSNPYQMSSFFFVLLQHKTVSLLRYQLIFFQWLRFMFLFSIFEQKNNFFSQFSYVNWHE